MKELWPFYYGQFLIKVSGAFSKQVSVCVCGGGGGVKIEMLFVNRGVGARF